ncbi:hypothetical protein ACJRO7_026448 [Eucalyptus globulus]|uniref:DUF7081 domain-containing protein n=1 Tax=Eucalyptus globulus TaxID=34317 RepID=A0ABD3JSU6_EUCGL
MKQESSKIDNANETDGNIHGPINCQEIRDSTEIIIIDESNGKSSEVKKNDDPWPVSSDISSDGLPYAPNNIPLPVAITGNYQDRYLYLPRRLRVSEKWTCEKYCFASKLSVERHIRTKFPVADIDAFFISFIWKVSLSIAIRRPFFPGHNEEFLRCKARNRMCSSLLEQAEKPVSPSWPCDHCCSEPKFCRGCCILRCTLIDGNHICGYIALLDRALQAYMARTVGGVIGLDAELFEASKSIDSPDEREKILKLAFSLLCGSQKTSAKTVLKQIESALTKLKFAPCDEISTADVGSGNESSDKCQEIIGGFRIFHKF